MNNTPIKDGQEYLTCPYCPSHRILKSRMQTHLVKCKENYPNVKIVTCKFNTTHRIPEPEIHYHHQNCPDKMLLDKHIYVPDNVDRDKYPVVVKDVPTLESWDNLDVLSYNPEKYCEENTVLRRIDLAPSSKRKEFRDNERLRFSYLQEEAKRLQRKEILPLRKPERSEDDTVDDLARDLQITRMTAPTNSSYLTQSKNADNVKNEKRTDASTGAIRKQPQKNRDRDDENENPTSRDAAFRMESFPALGETTSKSYKKSEDGWTRMGKGRSRTAK